MSLASTPRTPFSPRARFLSQMQARISPITSKRTLGPGVGSQSPSTNPSTGPPLVTTTTAGWPLRTRKTKLLRFSRGAQSCSLANLTRHIGPVFLMARSRLPVFFAMFLQPTAAHPIRHLSLPLPPFRRPGHGRIRSSVLWTHATRLSEEDVTAGKVFSADSRPS